MTTMTQHPMFASFMVQVAACAKEKFPQAADRIDHGALLVLDGKVRQHTACTNAWVVGSQSRSAIEYDVVEGVCNCSDYERHATHDNGYACKHVWAMWIFRRVEMRLAAWQPEPTIEYLPIEEYGQPTESKVPSIPSQFVVELHGKQFVQYAGLLAMAHAQGLQELSAEITVHVPDVIAIAKATAVFADGRRFSESADATPGNVTAKIRPHFVRMALTRAKARALRDALNIGLVAVEELGEVPHA